MEGWLVSRQSVWNFRSKRVFILGGSRGRPCSDVVTVTACIWEKAEPPFVF